MRRILPIAIFALLLGTLPARAQQLTLSTELDYLLVDQGFRDPDQRVTTSGFLPKVSLSLAGRLFPTSRVFLDLTGGLTQDTFGLSRQSTDNVRLVLRTEAPRYRLSLRHGRSYFSSSTEELGLSPSGFATDSQETDVALSLREPAWPALNLQYSRYLSDNSFGGASSRTQSTDSRIGAAYDLAPLHFRFDESQRTGDASGGNSFAFNARRFDVSFDTALFPKLDFCGDLQLSHSEIRSGATDPTSRDFRVGSLRLSTELTPKAALEAQLYSQQTSQFPNANDLSSRGASASLRSEVVPGLQFNLTGNLLHSEFAGRITDSTTASADLFARLDARNSLSLSFSPSHASFSNTPGMEQTAYRLNWTSQLDSQLELTASLDHFADTGADFAGRTDSKYLALRYHPDLQTTLGLGLLWDRAGTTGAGGETSQEARALDTELSWLPTSTLSLGCHFGLSRFRGVSDTRVTVPAFDLRWQADARSDLSVSWRMQTEVQRELEVTSRLGFTAFSGHFSRRLSPRSSLNVNYDVLAFKSGPFAYERRLGVSVTTGLGR